MNCTEAFTEYRSLLFAIAYRMLGSVMDAEDMVQETFIRCDQASTEDVQSPKAYLTSIVTRLSIDHLRSAKVQRETYVGEWLPEPLFIDTSNDPDAMTSLAESLSMAFLVMLERLSPVERAVFLLRKVFDYDYAEIAEMVDKSEANCRQIVARASQHVMEEKTRFDTSRQQSDALLQEFAQACLSGDIDGLMNVLAEDIVMVSDGGGKKSAALRPIVGADKSIRFLLGTLKKIARFSNTFEFRFARLNGQPGIINYIDGEVDNAMIFDMVDGKIQRIYTVRNPDKLKHLPASSN